MTLQLLKDKITVAIAPVIDAAAAAVVPAEGDAAKLAAATEIDLGRFELSYAVEAKFGDFAMNAAMVFARDLKQAPRDVAAKLVPAIREVDGVERVEVAGPGFINIWMTQEYWQDMLMSVTPEFAQSDVGDGVKVQVEYISANPTGPLTIGNGRGGFIGEVLSRVLDRAGYDVTREYYFNDAGTQISKLLESVKAEIGLAHPEERQYNGAYIKELAEKFRDELATKSDDELKVLITDEIQKRYIRPAIAKMGIEYDVWFNERELIRDGSFEKTVAALREKGLVFERDGAVWLKTGDFGDERGERVIIKSNGDPTYMAPDIAYHAKLFGERGYDWAIKVLGPDHVAQFPSVQAAVSVLYPHKRMTMAGYQQMRVMKDGKEVKVSKRLGQFVTIEELIDQVGKPVTLFLMLMRSAESHMDFDLDLAMETSAKNPYYYVMYAYARANSILAKAAEKGLKPATAAGQLDERELALVRQMSRLPELVEEMAGDYGVHRLTFFGLELAKLFQEYYESVKIIDLPADEAAQKLYVIQRFVTFMDVYWSLLGIEPVKRMEHDA